MAEATRTLNVHPKVKAAGQVAAVLLALDGLVVALIGAIPSAQVVAVLAVLHTVLPVVAGYLKKT